MNSTSWQEIFDRYNIHNHNFDKEPFIISNKMIKIATAHFTNTNEKEVRILCKQDSREDRPAIFVQNNLFILPIKNGTYAIIRGEGYIDIPPINEKPIYYTSQLGFHLETSFVGNSEMQHLDYAYAISLVRTFLNDKELVLTVRGRKYTPKFSFYVGTHLIEAKSVQTEVDAGYEGRDQVILIEAKNSKSKNTIIRQLFYPYRQWQEHTKKQVRVLFFEKQANFYCFWIFGFKDKNDYNSIELLKSAKFEINE
jgi:hypothetical protein